MLELSRVLLQIMLLRRGPEHLPRSWLLLYVAFGVWMLPPLIEVMAMANRSASGLVRDVSAWALTTLMFAGLLVAVGRRERVVQTITAMIGIGAVINVSALLVQGLLGPILGLNVVGTILQLLILWAVVVKGHILARALEQPLIVGILVSVVIFVIRIYLNSILAAAG